MKLKRQSLVSPGSISRLLQAAEQAMQFGDLPESLEILERARRLDPANPDILLRLGRVHGMRFDYAAAEDFFEKAIRLSNRKTRTLLMAGANANAFYNLELAERYLRRAAEQKDATAEILVQLASFYERVDRVTEAAQSLERAARLDASFPEIPLVRARLERQAGHCEAAEQLLRSLLPKADKETRVRGYYQLGTVLDRQGRYDEAMAAFLEAKASFQSEAGTYRLRRQTRIAHWREVLAGVSAEIFQRWFDSGRELGPARRLALLCGYPRSGTTLLEQVLDSHPDIISTDETRIFHQDACVPLAQTRPQELVYIDPTNFEIKLPVLEAAPVDLLRRLRENYFHSMERCLGRPMAGRLLVDKNPSFPLLLAGFQRVFPETRLLVALRDPRDVCLSCFMLELFGPMTLRHTAFFNLKDTVDGYVEETNIWRTLAPMMPGHYLEVRYEDMVEDLESASRKTLDFLGIPWDAGVLSFYERTRQKLIKMPNYADVSRPVFKTARGRWRNYQKYLEPYLPQLEPFVKAFGYQ